MAICSASASASASAASASASASAASAASASAASAASASAAAASSSMALTHPTSFVSSLVCKPAGPALLRPLPARQLAISASAIAADAAPPGGGADADAAFLISKRSLMTLMTVATLSLTPMPAKADIEEDYKKETQEVISQVRSTLTLDKSDPGRGDAVRALRDSSNQWVAKYRREKRFAGKPSYSNIYSVLNAVSGHYISYGDGAPLPAKRKSQILEEVETAEKALNRGR